MNPFKYGCIVNGSHFCDRPELAGQFAEYVRSGQNLVIQGERRMGKSSLVTNTLSHMRGWRYVYADFMDVRSTADVCNQLVDAMARFEAEDSIFKRTLTLLAHLRPTVTVDAMTGMPTITVDAHAAENSSSVTTALNALSELVRGGKTCVVFDEFQDILNVADGPHILALMRSRIQFLADTPFVFLGSARNDMLDIFLSPKSPFYKSATVFDVGTIDDTAFYGFITERFASGQRQLPREEFDAILKFTNRTPGDVQEYCDAIWQITEAGQKITSAVREEALRHVFAREGATFSAFSRRLTDIQFRVARALSRCGGHHPLSGVFLREASVSNSATVKRALNALISDGLVCFVDGEYKFFSPFFRDWIRRTIR